MKRFYDIERTVHMPTDQGRIALEALKQSIVEKGGRIRNSFDLSFEFSIGALTSLFSFNSLEQRCVSFGVVSLEETAEAAHLTYRLSLTRGRLIAIGLTLIPFIIMIAEGGLPARLNWSEMAIMISVCTLGGWGWVYGLMFQVSTRWAFRRTISQAITPPK